VAKATHALEALRILVHERRLERRRITRVSPITGIEEIITTVQSKSLYQLGVPAGRFISAADATEFIE
jgi:hypothetical protein